MGLTRITAQQISDSDFKQSVRVVTTSNTNLSGAPSTVDGVSLAVNNRILVAGQTTASQNGLYYVVSVGTGSTGTWTRSLDGDTTGEIASGMIVVVTEGTAYADTEWLLTTNDPIVIGTTALAFIQINGTIYSGTSNVTVINSGNVTISSAGTANVITVSTAGAYVTGLVSTTGNVNAANLYVVTDAVVAGNLTVNGTTTTINSNTITTNDKNITVANNQTTSANVDGAGLDAGGGTPIATWRYSNATTSWQSNVAVTPTSNGSLALGGTSNFWGTAYLTTVSATGNITGNYVIGNGSQLTGLPASYGNANVVANLAALGSNPVSTTGNITGNYIIGNGSQLTGLPASYGNANVVANLAALGSNPISTTGNITAGNLITGNGSGGNLTGANVISATTLSATGNISGGNLSGTSIVGTLTTAAQTNITSVGTLGSLAVTGNITSGNLSGTSIVGTLTTAAQPNITSVGTLGSLAVTGNITGGNILGGANVNATTHTGTTVSVSANVTGGNILTSGLISATGTINSDANVVAGTNTKAAPALFYTNSANSQYGALLMQKAGVERWLIGSDASSGNGNVVIRFNATTNYVTVTEAGAAIITGNVTGGNILTAGLVSATGNITGTNLFGTIQTATQLNITGLGTLTSLTVSGNTTSGNLLTGGLISATGAITGAGITGTSLTVGTGTITGGNIVNSNANGVGNIGSSTTYFNTVFAKATSAQYADLAEMYVADANYAPGTVVEFGGVEEITQTVSSCSTAVAGVISTNPSYLMNSAQQGKYVLPVALTGRVPCRVQGPVSKGDVLISSTMPGVAQRIGAHWQPGCIIGKSLGCIDDSSIQTIEVVVGRT